MNIKHLITLLVSVFLFACGSTEKEPPNATDMETDEGSTNDLGDDIDQTDCDSFAEKECHTTCMPFVAHIYDEVEQCYEREPTFISCEPLQGTLNTTTLARHIDGRCAEFPSTELPSNGQWTEDDECNELLTEQGVCE